MTGRGDRLVEETIAHGVGHRIPLERNAGGRRLKSRGGEKEIWLDQSGGTGIELRRCEIAAELAVILTDAGAVAFTGQNGRRVEIETNRQRPLKSLAALIDDVNRDGAHFRFS